MGVTGKAGVLGSPGFCVQQVPSMRDMFSSHLVEAFPPLLPSRDKELCSRQWGQDFSQGLPVPLGAGASVWGNHRWTRRSDDGEGGGREE